MIHPTQNKNRGKKNNVAFEGDSKVVLFEGNFSEYEENRRKRLGNDLTPKRIKYRKLQ